MEKRFRWKTAVVPLIVLVALACGLAGCGGSSGGEGSGKIKIGLVYKSLDPYYSASKEFAEKAASKDPNVELFVAAGQSGIDSDVQIQKVENLLTKGIDVLCIAADGPELTPILERAVAQGVKVILLDQKIPGWTKAASYIGTDLPKGAKLAGEYLLKHVKAGEEVGILIGLPGLAAATERYTDTAKMLKEAGVKVYLTSQADDCEQDKAVHVTQDLLVAHPDLSAIYSICGPSSLGVDQVVNARSSGKPIIRLGFDVFPEQAEGILDGKENAAIAQFPGRLGTYGIENAIKIANGEEIPRRIDTGTELVTKSNAKEFLHYN